MGKLDFLVEEVEALKREGLYTTIRTIGSPQGAWVIVDGKKVLNMCANNYLGFANHPKLKEAAKKAIDEFGVGPAAVRTIAGTMSLHLELEEKLAKFKGAEATISFQSGFNANLATIPAIVGKEDAIFSDELNHASIIDGCRLSRATIIRFAHRDPADLERKLREEGGKYRRKLVITDGVFSMDGDIAPLPEIAEISEKYDALLMVDDAHGEGVLGRGGRGIVDHFGLHGKVHIEVGTLSKAFGVVGGYVAGSKALIEFLKQKARPFLFSSAVTPADVAACIAAVDILTESDELVRKLWDNASYFKKGMVERGFDIGHSETPITPVMLGEAPLAQEFSRRLFEEGIFAQAIGYPTVPRGKARIRVMISATHSREDLDFALDKFEKIGKELGVLRS
ncbi:MAG TPA: glycine C-acetyltransferase [candidate division WOR-3 bacterium]|uniref:8-amino-7-ketopelargonate synthase n=1 Tax=candidate division WOR-3 bacterium TaxID=2052148 RepID=A0A7C0XAY9_UNCW3|nr:MAG: 8-amino-7-oxononanoate synthase [Candidatus Hydrothermae bacterium]HDM90435.1 glycine C-acetyltransferase [candidate division WOR-3 bacterium]